MWEKRSSSYINNLTAVGHIYDPALSAVSARLINYAVKWLNKAYKFLYLSKYIFVYLITVLYHFM